MFYIKLLINIIKEKKNLIIFILLLLGMYFHFFYEKTVVLGDGVKVETIPLQNDLSYDLDDIMLKGYQIHFVDEMKVHAKILGKKYYGDINSELMPFDLALGWQNMSDESILKDIKISQRGRWYYWRVQNFPIPRSEIETQSSNWHIIPANDEIRDIIDDADKGSLIYMEGYLVNISNPSSGYTQHSSTTRKDTGNGACELMYVNEAYTTEVDE